MRKIFLKWLLFFIVVAFIVTYAASFTVQTRMANEHAKSLVRLKLVDVKRQLYDAECNLKEIKAETNETALLKARSLAYIILAKPESIKSEDEMKKIASALSADDVYIIDGKGIVVSSNIWKYVGFDMNSSEQSRFFMPILRETPQSDAPSAANPSKSLSNSWMKASPTIHSPRQIPMSICHSKNATPEDSASFSLKIAWTK